MRLYSDAQKTPLAKMNRAVGPQRRYISGFGAKVRFRMIDLTSEGKCGPSYGATSSHCGSQSGRLRSGASSPLGRPPGPSEGWSDGRRRNALRRSGRTGLLRAVPCGQPSPRLVSFHRPTYSPRRQSCRCLLPPRGALHSSRAKPRPARGHAPSG